MDESTKVTEAVVPPSPLAGSVTPSTTAYAGSLQSSAVMAASGTLNGEGSGNGDGESSKQATLSPDPAFHALNLTSYIFNIGYLGQNWADIQVVFFDTALRLHRIILSRSPYLAHLMLNNVPGSTIHLSFPDDNITKDSVHIALQHLYNPAQHLVTPVNARAVLAAACLFEGMPELVHHAYSICRDTISTDNVIEYIQWLASTSAPQPNGYHDSSTMYGSVMVNGGQATVSSSQAGDTWSEDGYPRYGEWTLRLKQDVLDFVMQSLPQAVIDSSKPLASDPDLLAVYSRLPFELFKLCVESPQLPFNAIQERFAFAKKVIALRKKLGASSQMEESVVLAMKGGADMEVHITRKAKRSRAALWKVEG